MLKIRLTRLGRKKAPFYRIAVMEAHVQRDGKAVEYVGTYNPLVAENQVVLKEESVLKYLLNGAQPTETVKSILVKEKVWDKFLEAKKK